MFIIDSFINFFNISSFLSFLEIYRYYIKHFVSSSIIWNISNILKLWIVFFYFFYYIIFENYGKLFSNIDSLVKINELALVKLNYK